MSTHWTEQSCVFFLSGEENADKSDVCVAISETISKSFLMWTWMYGRGSSFFVVVGLVTKRRSFFMWQLMKNSGQKRHLWRHTTSFKMFVVGFFVISYCKLVFSYIKVVKISSYVRIQYGDYLEKIKNCPKILKKIPKMSKSEFCIFYFFYWRKTSLTTKYWVKIEKFLSYLRDTRCFLDKY